MTNKLKKILVALLIFGVIVFILNILVDNPYSHRLARAVINKKISEITPLAFDFKALKLSVMPLGFDLYGFTVGQKEDPANTLLKISHIKARVSMWSIVIGIPKLDILELTELQASWPPPPGFDKLFNAEKSSEPIVLQWPLPIKNLPIEVFALKNSRLYFELPPKQPDGLPLLIVAANGVDLSLDLDDLDDLILDLKLTDLSMRYEELNLTDNLSVNVFARLRHGEFEKSKFKLKSDKIDVSGALTGKFEKNRSDVVSNIFLNLEPEGNADLAVLGRIFDFENTKGKVDAKAVAKFVIPVNSNKEFSFNLDGHAKTYDGMISDFKLYDTETDISVDLDKIAFENTKVTIDGQESIDVKGKIFFKKPPLEFEFFGAPKNLKLSKLLEALNVSFDVIEADITSPNIHVVGRGEPLAMKVTATADFARVFPTPLADLDKSQYPAMPTCRLNVALGITSKRLTFDGTQGHCFEPAEQNRIYEITPGVARPPENAKYVSDLNFAGEAAFNDAIGINLKIASPNLDLNLANHIVQGGTKGFGQISTHIKGPYDKVVVTTDLSAQEMTVRNIPLNQVRGQVLLKDSNTLHWAGINVDLARGGRIVLSDGQMKIDDKFTYKTKINGENIPKDFIVPFVKEITDREDLTFEIASMDGELGGPLLIPLAYQGNLKLRLNEGYLGEEHLFSTAAGAWKLTSDGFSTQDLKVELNGLETETQFQLKRQRPFSFERSIDSQELLVRLGIDPNDHIEINSQSEKGLAARERKPDELNDLQGLPFVGQHFKTAKLDGAIGYQLKMQGDFNSLQGNFNCELSQVKFFGSGIANINAEGIIQKSKLDMLLTHSGNALEGRMSIDFSKESLPYTWYFRANRLDLRAVGSPFFATDPRNYAYLTADWNMAGELQNWWASEGSLQVNDIRIKFMRDFGSDVKSFDLGHEQPVKLSVSPKGWKFENKDGFRLNGQQVTLHLNTKDNRLPENLDLEVEGVLDLALLRDVLTQVESASGKVLIKGAIKGSLDDPDFAFEFHDVKSTPFNQASWHPVSVGIADMRPPMTNMEFDVRYKHGLLQIDSFTAEKGKGKITASGVLVVDGKREETSNIDVNFSDTAIIVPASVIKSFDTLVSGSLNISGARRPYRLSGDIHIDRARSTQEFDIRDEIIGALQRRSYNKPVDLEQPYFNLDIRVIAESGIAISNRNIQANMSADLTINGTDQAPSVLGQIDINRGKFVYKRDFRVTQGIITFDDPVTPDPRLDILGLSEVSGYRIYVAITGRASDPRVDLSVDPPTLEDGSILTKFDILLMLSTGNPPEAKDKDITAQDAAAAEALNILVGQFEQPVEKLFDLSGQNVVRQLYLDTYSDPETGSPTARVNFPLNLNEDWDVIFRVDDKSNWRVSLGYSVHDSISVSGSFDRQKESEGASEQRTPADTGVDLKFRFAFP